MERQFRIRDEVTTLSLRAIARNRSTIERIKDQLSAE